MSLVIFSYIKKNYPFPSTFFILVFTDLLYILSKQMFFYDRCIAQYDLKSSVQTNLTDYSYDISLHLVLLFFHFVANNAFYFTLSVYVEYSNVLYAIVGRVVQSVEPLTRGWTVRDRIPVGD